MAGGSHTIRVMVVEDVWTWASAVERQLDLAADVELVGTAPDADSAIAMAAETRPDVALVDVVLGDDSGLRVARSMAARALGAEVVFVTAHASDWMIEEARRAGAAAVVSKDDLTDGEIVAALVRAAHRRLPIPDDHLARAASDGASASYGLTPSEVELIRCFNRGMETPAIARYLSLSGQTIRNRTRTIGEKLGVSGRLGIVIAAQRAGIVKPPGPA